MSLQENLDALNARLQKVLKPGADEILEQHMQSLRTSGFLDGVLAVGTKAPDFSLVNQHGKTIASRQLLEQGPLVVCFTRGGWCPFCAEEAMAFNAIYTRFTEAGVQVIFLTPQRLEGIKEWEQKAPAQFSILWDEGNKVGEAFGVVYTFPEDLRTLYECSFSKNIPEINDAEGWKLPIPACFVVDTEGTIRYAEADPNYRVRPEPEETLNFVRNIAPVRS